MERAELATYFDENLFVPELKAQTKDQVLQEMVNLLVG